MGGHLRAVVVYNEWKVNDSQQVGTKEFPLLIVYFADRFTILLLLSEITATNNKKMEYR
jgi:hypothetical protein